MRQPQQQQNRRGRGRGRKPQNPLQRGYESNGPDVKIRGNAAHIAEKYITLARDALSSSDTVIAENYLQHAEHYNRIIAAAQPQPQHEGQSQQGQGSAPNGQANTQAQGHNRNRRNDSPNDLGSEQPREAPAAVPAAARTESSAPESANEEAPEKPARRRRAPRTKMAGNEDTTSANPGPVRMGDVPADEPAN